MRCEPYPTRNSHVFKCVILALSLIFLPFAVFADIPAERVQNRIMSVVQDEDGILISTQLPLDDQYAVYDALDPLRIVIDFSEMDVAGLDPEINLSEGPVKKVKTSSFDLSSGQFGRVELLLNKSMKFETVNTEKGLRILLKEGMAADDPSGKDWSVEAYSSVDPSKGNSPAKTLGSVQVGRGEVVFYADGEVGKVKHFTLQKPGRLVVDFYGVAAGFKEKTFPLNSGFNEIRVGTYPQKLRFVFDAQSSQIPEYSIKKEGNTLSVVWGSETGMPVPAANAVPAPAVVSKKAINGDVAITDVNFTVDNDKSILAIGLSGPADIVEPVVRGNILQFGIKRASISRQHRRTIDPSVFPSSVRLITPYTVRSNGVGEVRFAVEMKSVQAYEFRRENNPLLLVLDNGPYAEPLHSGVERKVIPVEASRTSEGRTAPAAFDVDRSMAFAGVDAPGSLYMDPDSITIQRSKAYVGQKISLVFDDADIRNILQLIGEVSDLNIIVSDEVKGNVTLRLVDVPWDQALDLVLEIRELGKLQDGNILRILPAVKIRQLQQEQFAAARAKEKLEDLVTDLVPVNYTDVESLVKSCEKRLSDRGKVIGDVRDKKLIITDIPSVVADIKQLVRMLDTPVRQVLIEARIVEASATFSRDLGVNWGLSYQHNPGSGIDGNDASISGGGTLIGIPVGPGQVTSGLISGLTFGQVGIDKTVLDLRLAALEQSGHGRIVSTPRVSTLNGEEAEVAQGTEIPYLSVSEDGTKTEFKKAELSLKVTPEINPDGSVILEIEAKNDSRGANTGLAEAPAIDTKRATTKVLVKDGETTVIGGIFIQDKQESVSGVPWLMNIPVLGYLFKSRSVSEERRELLVFITPRILD